MGGSKWTLFKAVITLAAVLIISGFASAQTTSVTDVQSPDLQSGNTEISFSATIDCVTIGDIVSFEAVQNQGRHHGLGVEEFVCTGVGQTTATYSVIAFDGLKFRPGPITLLVRIYDSARNFISGQGFHIKG